MESAAAGVDLTNADSMGVGQTGCASRVAQTLCAYECVGMIVANDPVLCGDSDIFCIATLL